MVGFGFPWMLLGAFFALPALYAIYKLRQRTRRKLVVSSLFLWRQVQQTRAGGHKLQKFQSSWLFWLELLILCLLLLAAADPTVSLKRDRGPLMVVLDDSFSMQAGGDASARRLAEAALRKLLKRGDYSFFRLILAGSQPRLLGGPLADEKKLGRWLKRWRCLSPSSSLSSAISLAWQLGGARARLLILTDHPPPHKIPPTRVRWWAFGKQARSNVAITYASRVRLDTKDWCLLEVAFFGKGQREIALSLQEGSSAPTSKRLTLRSGVPKRLRIAVTKRTETLIVSVAKDALTIDDQVVLLPRKRKPVGVQVDLPTGPARELLLRTLRATKGVRFVVGGGALRWTQRSRLIAPSPGTWGVHWHDRGADVAYRGPFVVHRTHPVSKGLSLRGVIWGASVGKPLPGLPLITAGNTPLLTWDSRADGGRSLHLRWRPGISTLSHTQNWPILIWNIIHWRQRHMPGLRNRNVRLGSEARLRVAPFVDRVEVTPPGQRGYKATVLDGVMRIPALGVGRYVVKTEKRRYQFVVNALQADESDLRSTARGRWGKWPPRAERKRAQFHIAWLLLVLSVVLFACHGWLSYQQQKGGHA